MNILDEAIALKQYMVDQRNYFHSHPELGLQEFNTCLHIEEELNKLGISNRRVAGTNVIAEIDSGRPGKTLFLRADIDALPIQDAKNVPYRSQTPGVMHACGHDGHTAYLLGAAQLILRHKADFSGKVILAFQAAEEVGKGARDIIEAGVLDDVDRTFGIHFSSGMKVGTYGIKTGPDMASCDRFRIKIHGKAAHITTPQNGSDSLFIGALMATQFQTIVSRLISPVEGGLVGIGRFNAGTTYNIIPGEAELEGTIRAFSAASRKKMADAVTSIARNVASEYGATVDVDIDDLCDPCINPADTAAEVAASARRLVSEEAVITNLNKRFGSDNFADFSRKTPGTYVHVGSSDGPATSAPHHNEYFDLAEDSYSYAAALAVQYALDYLSQ